MPSELIDDYYSLSEIRLPYYSKIKATDRPQIRCSHDSCRVFRHHWDDEKLDFVEQSKLLVLNQGNRVLGIYNLSTGCTASTIVDTRMVFAAALKANASKIVLAHNHPSENLEPSASDREVTNRLRQAGVVMSLPLLDYLIITRSGFYSFTDDEKYYDPEVTTRDSRLGTRHQQ